MSWLNWLVGGGFLLASLFLYLRRGNKMPEHVTITDPNIHEPKGISTALENQVYVADGAGSGEWRFNGDHFVGQSNSDFVTPHQLPIDNLTWKQVDLDVVEKSSQAWIKKTNPNLVFEYTRDFAQPHMVVYDAIVRQSTGGNLDLRLTAFFNGTEVFFTEVRQTLANNYWTNVRYVGFITFTLVSPQIDFRFRAGSGTPTIDIARSAVSIISLGN